MSAIVALGAFALGLAAYLAAARHVRRWPGRRTLAFALGLAVLSLAPLFGAEPLAGHMLEHAAIAALAAPLIVVGSPLALTLRALRGGAREALLRFVRHPAIRLLTHPAAAASAFVLAQWALHSPAAIAAADDPVGHAAEHLLLVAASLLFWLPVAGVDPLPHRLRRGGRVLYLFVAASAVDLAAVWLIARGEDLAGAAMLGGTLPLALAGLLALWEWLGAEEREAELAERRTGVAGA